MKPLVYVYIWTLSIEKSVDVVNLYSIKTFEKEFCVLTFFPKEPLASKRTVSRALSHSEKVWEILLQTNIFYYI